MNPEKEQDRLGKGGQSSSVLRDPEQRERRERGLEVRYAHVYFC